MAKRNDLDQRVLGAITGAERIRLLLRDAGFRSIAVFGAGIGKSSQEVSFCINGDREYPEIRDALAQQLGLSRSEIDRLIASEPAEKVG